MAQQPSLSVKSACAMGVEAGVREHEALSSRNLGVPQSSTTTKSPLNASEGQMTL